MSIAHRFLVHPEGRASLARGFLLLNVNLGRETRLTLERSTLRTRFSSVPPLLNDFRSPLVMRASSKISR